MMQAELVYEKMAIQETSHRYAHYCDTGDYENLVRLFTDDGILDETAVGTPICQGHASLRAFFDMAGPRNSSMFHLGANYIIDILDSDRATATHWMFYEGIRNDQPNRARIIKGSFYEEFLKIDGVWKIALKRLTLFAPVHWSSPREE